MKKVRTYIVVILVVIGLMNTLCASVFATESGSITVHANEAQNKTLPIAGVQITLYHIAQLANDNSTRYILTSDFSGFTQPLTWNTSSDCAELAAQLYDYAESVHSTGSTKITGKDGQVKFDALERGLYLVVQTGKESEKYKTFSPGLIEIPLYDANQFEYHVNLYPKIDKTSPTPTPTIPIPDPDTPGGGDLPSTGLLQWPVPVMALVGCILLLVGGTFIVLSRKKEN